MKTKERPCSARLTGLVAKLHFTPELTAEGHVKVRLEIPVEERYDLQSIPEKMLKKELVRRGILKQEAGHAA